MTLPEGRQVTHGIGYTGRARISLGKRLAGPDV